MFCNTVKESHPKGHNVRTEKSFGVLHHPEMAYPWQRRLSFPTNSRTWVQMVKEVPHTSDVAGDGTTTATVLAQAMVRRFKGRRCGMNPMDPKRGIDKAVGVAVTACRKCQSPAPTTRRLPR